MEQIERENSVSSFFRSYLKMDLSETVDKLFQQLL